MFEATLAACFAWAQYYALAAAGIAFLVLSLVHLLRITYRMRVTIGEWKVQMWISYVAFFVSLFFALWMFAVSIW